jgi:hypothetical protein
MLKKWIIGAVIVWMSLLPSLLPASDEASTPVLGVPAHSVGQLQLSEAVICETLENFKPLNPSAVFSVQTGSVMCFTAFDHVPAQTSIFHDWIRQDKLIFRKKLILKTPSWSSVSSIQLREADKGAWRVDVRDADGHLLRILRFSITD